MIDGWNYRLIRDGDGYLGIHEVYYDSKGNIVNWTDEVSLYGETAEDLRKQLEDAISKPILVCTIKDGEQTLVSEGQNDA